MKKSKMFACIFTAFMLSEEFGYSGVPAFAEDFGDPEGMIILSGDDSSEELSGQTQDGLVLEILSSGAAAQSEKYCQITLQVQLTNWELGTINLNETVSARLVYEDEYVFDADIDYGGIEEIQMLEQVEGTFSFTVPGIVAFAEEDEIKIGSITFLMG